MVHDWDKGRRYCNACGCDIEDGHPCPGNGQDQILVLVRQLGKDKVMRMVDEAGATICEEQRKREIDGLKARIASNQREIERLKELIVESQEAAAKLAELERT